MLKMNNEKLNECGFAFATINDLLFYVSRSVEWLESHNKNYNREQYSRIYDLKNILDCIEAE